MHIFAKEAQCSDGLNSNEQNTRVQDYLWYGSFKVSGLSLDCLWTVSGLSLDFLWTVWTFMDCLDFHGLSGLSGSRPASIRPSSSCSWLTSPPVERCCFSPPPRCSPCRCSWASRAIRSRPCCGSRTGTRRSCPSQPWAGGWVVGVRAGRTGEVRVGECRVG